MATPEAIFVLLKIEVTYFLGQVFLTSFTFVKGVALTNYFAIFIFVANSMDAVSPNA